MTKIKDLVEKYGDREIDDVELEKILKPVKKTIYNLEDGDMYWFINPFGQACGSEWNNMSVDKGLLNKGNVFLTEEDAEFKVEYLKVKAALKRYASMCEEPVDWRDENQIKHYLRYDHDDNEIYIGYEISCNNGAIFFTNHSILEQAIKAIGEERIIKYYFGVKV